MNESRQVKRNIERLSKKRGDSLATLQQYWIPLKRKSRAGVEYIYYKKVVDKIGLKPMVDIIKDKEDKLKK